MNQSDRIREFFKCSDQQAREVFDRMVSSSGREQDIDDLPPGAFASLACRAAEALASSGDPEYNLTNLADNLLELAGLASETSDETRDSLRGEMLALSHVLAIHPGPPVVLMRRSIALVPHLWEGRVFYQPIPIVDLDALEVEKMERELIPTVALCMAGAEIDWRQKDKLRDAILFTTNATPFEADAVIKSLRLIVTRQAPDSLPSFADLCLDLLGRVRERYAITPHSRRGEIPPGLGRTSIPFEDVS